MLLVRLQSSLDIIMVKGFFSYCWPKSCHPEDVSFVCFLSSFLLSTCDSCSHCTLNTCSVLFACLCDNRALFRILGVCHSLFLFIFIIIFFCLQNILKLCGVVGFKYVTRGLSCCLDCTLLLSWQLCVWHVLQQETGIRAYSRRETILSCVFFYIYISYVCLQLGFRTSPLRLRLWTAMEYCGFHSYRLFVSLFHQ